MFFKKFCINAVDEKLKKQFDRQIPWAPTFSVNIIYNIFYIIYIYFFNIVMLIL